MKETGLHSVVASAVEQRRDGLTIFLIAPFVVAAIVDLPRVIRVGSVTALGLLAVSQLAVALAGIFLRGRYPRPILSIATPYILFLIWMIGRSLFETPTQDTIQNGLTYVLLCGQFVLAGTLAAEQPLETTDALKRGIWWAEIIAWSLSLVSLLLVGIPTDDDKKIQWLIGPRGVALMAIVPVAWHLAGWCHSRPRAGQKAIAWILLIFISLSRTASAVVIIMSALTFGFHAWLNPRRLIHRMPVLIAGAAAMVVLVVALSATFHDRLFEGINEVQVGGVAVSTSGRDTIWPTVINSAWTHPALGGGMGSSQKVLEQNNFDPTNVGHPHNDYLRIWHDGGFLGLALFLLSIGRWMTLFGGRWTGTGDRTQTDPHIALAAVLALLGVCLTALTDNVVVYSYVMSPLGVLMGVAAGLAFRSGPPARLQRRFVRSRLVTRGAHAHRMHETHYPAGFQAQSS